MKPETHAELDRIASAVCDTICRWPHELDEPALQEKCDACQPLVDMANMVEKLECSGTDTHHCQDSLRLRGGEGEAHLEQL